MSKSLATILAKEEKLAIGLMSGTSADGVDAALVRLRGHGEQTEVELADYLAYPYPDGLRAQILQCSRAGGGSVDEICRLNVLLGEIFSEAALALLRQALVAPEAVDFIGSHGQTVHHLPEPEAMFGHEVRATLQIAEPAVIAKRTGILTIADFRPADLAVGGQGAPLVPIFDFIRFRSEEKSRALVNIGGIANFTILPRGCTVAQVRAYDTGPGNMVIDYLSQKLFNRPFDRDGEIASRGICSAPLLAKLLAHPYFELAPPKSTGREMFGAEFAEQALQEAQSLGLAPDHVITTTTELTARTIWQSYQKDIAPETAVDQFIISGGGARNGFLMQRLRALAGTISVKPMDDYGIPADAKEAVCFAVLANETLHGAPANVPGATGAREATILGKICF